MRAINTERKDVRDLWSIVDDEFRVLINRIHNFESGQPTGILTVDSSVLPGELVLCDPPIGGSITLYLPSTTRAMKGSKITVKHHSASTGTVVLQTATGDTLDGATSHTLSSREFITIVAATNGTWAIVSH